MSRNANNIVRQTLDPRALPALTPEERAELEAVAAMPDEQIDYSDAPHRPDAVWMRAVPNTPGPKQQITLRLDADLVDFFKSTGRRYQTRINAVLRAYVEAVRNER